MQSCELRILPWRKAGRPFARMLAFEPNARAPLSEFTNVHSSPDSDDTYPGDDSEEFGREDAFLVSSTTENKFYGKSFV